MRQLQPVVWSKGVLLSPHHLQAQDRFVEDSLHFAAEALSFGCWGFSSLQIDGAAVREGQFQIGSAAGLMPDGLPFDFADADPAPRSRVLDECFASGRGECVFYLAIPQSRRGGVNISPRRGALSTRYYPESQMFRDENSSGTEKPVSFARRNFQILAEGESNEGSVVLPLARVVREEAGQYELDGNFIAPMINARGSGRLTGILRSLVEVLAARSRQLGGVRRQRNQSLADFSASDIASFWLLYSINSHLPVLRQMLETSQVHPEPLYRQMLGLAGALTTFSSSIAPQDLPNYDHHRLGHCFLSLESALMELLDTVVPGRFISIPLRRLRDSIYVADFDSEQQLDKARLYLAIAAEIPSAELIARTPALVKVCSATHLETLVRQALPGLPLRRLPSPPPQIPVKLDFQYFSLDRAGAAWDAIRRARNFGVYVPGEIANPRMELILIPAPDHSSR
jgi:type VI secretion system protein ImpJ